MLLISARYDFWSDNVLAIEDEARPVDLGGTQPSVPVADAVAYVAALPNKRVLMLIHGYNNEPEDVNNAYAIIEDKVGANVADAIDHLPSRCGQPKPDGDCLATRS